MWNHTIAMVVVDVLSFLVVFMACFIVLNLVIKGCQLRVPVPCVKHFDAITGGVLGFARIFFVFLLFTLVPILLTALPVQAISDYINASKFGSHFL